MALPPIRPGRGHHLAAVHRQHVQRKEASYRAPLVFLSLHPVVHIDPVSLALRTLGEVGERAGAARLASAISTGRRRPNGPVTVRAFLSCDEEGTRLRCEGRILGEGFCMFDKSPSRYACAVWVLVLSILLSFDPPQVLVYVDSQDVNGVSDMVEREACPYLRAEGVPLPVPFEVRWLRQAGESQRFVPDPERRVPGVLTICPEEKPIPTDSR
jgi:hypothetical protein